MLRSDIESLNSQQKIVCLQDAAVTQAACLPAGYKLYQASAEGSCLRIDCKGHTLLAHDAVAIGGRHIPYAPWDALLHLNYMAIGQTASDNLAFLGHTQQLRKC